MSNPKKINLGQLHNIQRPGRTPLLPVRLKEKDPSIWCKLEYLHSSGSIKDRIAHFIIEKGLRNGKIRPDSTIIEASSGSTSIALASVCAKVGLKFIAVMPENTNPIRLKIIKAFGAKIILTPQEKGILGSIKEAQRLNKKIKNSFFSNQFMNIDNVLAHRLQTAQEIVWQLPYGNIDAIVSGVGTGGTLVGLYQGFRDHGSSVKAFAAKPINKKKFKDEECSSFSSKIPGVVEGLSSFYHPKNLPNLIEIEVTEEEAITTAKELILKGFPVGYSSGLNFAAALKAKKHLGKNANIITVFPDRMERYLSDF